MNLRHKKPINSYRGQANSDKNEINDDDFKHQLSPSKKLIINNGQQMFKYSKILTKFIMNINENYHQKIRNPKRSKTEIEQVLDEVKFTRDEPSNIKFSKMVEQLKQKRKFIPKIQQSKEIQKKQIKIDPVQKLSLKKSQQNEKTKTKKIKQIINIENSSKQQVLKKQPSILEHLSQRNIPSNISLNSSLPFQNYSPLISPLIQIQQSYMMSPSMLESSLFNQSGMCLNNMYMPVNQYLTAYQQIIKNGLLQQYIYRQKQRNNLDYMNRLNQTQVQELKHSLYQDYLNTMVESVPLRYNQPIKSISPIYNLNDVFLNQRESIFNFSPEKPNIIAKRSSFHIGNAYHIYLNQLRNKGQDIKNIDAINPIKQSIQLKQKQKSKEKNSQIKLKKK